MGKIFIILGIIVGAAIIFYVIKLMIDTQATFPKTTAPQQPIPVMERPTGGHSDSSSTIEAIQKAFAKKNKTLGLDLGSYMANSSDIVVVIYGSECCQPMNRKQAATALDDYLKNAKGSWNCDQDNPISQKILAKSDQFNYLQDALFCYASDGHTAGFHVNNQYLIDRIVLILDYKLLIN